MSSDSTEALPEAGRIRQNKIRNRVGQTTKCFHQTSTTAVQASQNIVSGNIFLFMLSVSYIFEASTNPFLLIHEKYRFD